MVKYQTGFYLYYQYKGSFTHPLTIISKIVEVKKDCLIVEDIVFSHRTILSDFTGFPTSVEVKYILNPILYGTLQEIKHTYPELFI